MEPIHNIPAQTRKESSWKIFLNGKNITDVEKLVIANKNFGELVYRSTKFGKDGFTFKDNGGAATVPYSMVDGSIHIGVIEQNRPLQGGMVLNIPRGFKQPEETQSIDTARREFFEETGLNDEKAFKQLPGEKFNPNSTFFDTSTADNPVHFFAIEIKSKSLEMTAKGLQVKRGLISKLADRDKQLEMIGNFIFIPWKQAVALEDGFTVAGVARLLSIL